MFNFITLKDPHYSFGFQNSLRFNYEKNILHKLSFVQKYCKSNGISHKIYTGDVFDSSHEDKWSFKKYRKNKRVLEAFPRSGINIYSNQGNHDMFHGLEDSKDTIFGEMVHDGIINNISMVPLIKDIGEHRIHIQGIDFANNQEVVKEKLYHFNKYERDNDKIFKVVVLHSNISPEDVILNDINITDFTYSSLVLNYPNVDMFICGHYHVGYDTQCIKRKPRIGGKDAWIINNWNFTRVSRDYETELGEHTPEFEDIKISVIDDKFVVDCETVIIPHEVYEETFTPKFIEIDKLSKKEISSFFKTINVLTIKESVGMSDNEQLDAFVKVKNYDQLVLNTAIDYLNDAQS